MAQCRVFDGAKEEWTEYAECLENYFEVNDITNDTKRRAILLNVVGPAYCLIKMHVPPGVLTGSDIRPDCVQNEAALLPEALPYCEGV